LIPSGRKYVLTWDPNFIVHMWIWAISMKPERCFLRGPIKTNVERVLPISILDIPLFSMQTLNYDQKSVDSILFSPYNRSIARNEALSSSDEPDKRWSNSIVSQLEREPDDSGQYPYYFIQGQTPSHDALHAGAFFSWLLRLYGC
jgi:hypothetical protein